MISQWSLYNRGTQFRPSLSGEPASASRSERAGVDLSMQKIFAFLQTGLLQTQTISDSIDESVSSSILFPVDQALRNELSIYLSQKDWQRMRRFLGDLWESLSDISQCLKSCSPQLESELKCIRTALSALQSFRGLEDLEVGGSSSTLQLQRGLSEWTASLQEMEQVISRLIGDQPRPWSAFIWLEADLALTGVDRMAGHCAEWATWLLALRRDLVMTAAPLWNSRGPEIDLVHQLWLTLDDLHQVLLELSHGDELPTDLPSKLGGLGETLMHLAEIESATTEYFSLNWPEVPTHSPWADLLAAHVSSRSYSTSARWWKHTMVTLRPMLEWLIDEPRADLILDFDEDFCDGLDVTELYPLAI
jgi:hypothetical protein